MKKYRIIQRTNGFRTFYEVEAYVRLWLLPFIKCWIPVGAMYNYEFESLHDAKEYIRKVQVKEVKTVLLPSPPKQ